MAKEHIENELNELMPDRPSSIDLVNPNARKEAIEQAASKEQSRLNAKEIAAKLYRERSKLRKLEEKKSEEHAESDKYEMKIQEQKERVKAIENIDANVPVVVLPENAQYIQGTTRPEIAKLLAKLQINTDIRLTRTDTMNLLSCLLTCNEKQLDFIYTNKDVPIAIKIVIKRLLEDAKLGNMESVEKLWDRVFGKAGMLIDLPQEQQTLTGILPNTRVSREAYMIIRDTIIGN